jgi:hypothetical protein
MACHRSVLEHNGEDEHWQHLSSGRVEIVHVARHLRLHHDRRVGSLDALQLEVAQRLLDVLGQAAVQAVAALDEVDAGFNMGGHISSRGRGRDRMSGATQLGYRIGYWIAEWLWRRWRRR